ncbi:MAG: heme o synthase, partial [Acidimicrobiales bacterium]
FERTARQIAAYSVLVLATSMLFGWTAGLGAIYFATAAVVGVIFCARAAELYRDQTEARAMRLFHWSITYVTLLFASMAVDQLVLH